MPASAHETVCKPSSVLDSHLSTPCVSARLLPPFGTGRASHGSCRRCFGWGLHGAPDYPGAGGLLPHLSILTACAAVYFCCTFPGVASAGISPAPCPVKLGLSSLTGTARPRDCPAVSQVVLYHVRRRLSINISIIAEPLTTVLPEEFGKN